jgi:hypothetical protein
MNTKTIFAALLLVGAVGVVGDAMAKRIQANSKQSGKAFTDCNNNGGVSWPQTATNPTYGCFDRNGNGLVCGGGTAEEKKTCDTFRTGTGPRLPTRDDAFKADPVVEGEAGGEKKDGP